MAGRHAPLHAVTLGMVRGWRWQPARGRAREIKMYCDVCGIDDQPARRCWSCAESELERCARVVEQVREIITDGEFWDEWTALGRSLSCELADARAELALAEEVAAEVRGAWL